MGKGNAGLYDDVPEKNRIKEVEFMLPMYAYIGAADVVITRAGANTLAEQGAMHKAVIVVPNDELTSGHQIHNADILARHNAALVVRESELKEGDSGPLAAAVERLLDDEKLRRELGINFGKVTVVGAGKRIAELLITLGNEPTGRE